MVCASLKIPRVGMGNTWGGWSRLGCTVGVLLGVVCYDII